MRMHDLRSSTNEDGWRATCDTVVIQMIQNVLGIVNNGCAYTSCNNEEDRADVPNDGVDNDSDGP